MLRSPRVQFALLLTGIAVLVIVAYGQAQPESSAVAPGPAAPVEQAVADPSASNVDPSFHAQLMALRQEVDAAPTDTTVLLRLARLEQDAHQFAEAAATYERVLTLAPDHRQAYLDLALSYGQVGQWAEARSATERLLARYPDDPAALYNLGAIHANQGETDDARRIWTRVQQQTQDAAMAERATASLARLNAMVASGSSPAEAPDLAPVRQPMSGTAPPIQPGTPLPPSHPPMEASREFQPILADQ